MECPNCRFQNPEGMNFCGKCGQPLAADSSPDLPAYANRSPREYTPPFLLEKVLVNRNAMVGGRKHVSVFFADVTGFTTLSETLDPEAVHDIMDGCFEILGQEIHGAGGTINQYTGDGVMALFGAPVAYEDHAARACHAAVHIQARLRNYGQEVRSRFGVKFQMRIGINAGTVVVGAIGDNLRLDYTAIGDTTNLAARLEASAPPGGIFVSSAVKEAAEAFFRFQREGDFDIKGKRDPVTVFSLQGKREETGSLRPVAAQTLFVNREPELNRLMTALDTTRRGRFQLVTLEGEAGVGKSRLLAAFQNAARAQNILFLKGRCRPYGETMALYPISGMFRGYFEIKDGDSFKTVREKIRAGIRQRDLIPRLEKIFELFGSIRSNDANHALFEGEKRRMFRAILDLLSAIITHRPVVLLLDDMQWADQTTLDFLSFLTAPAIHGPLLAVCCGRSTLRPWCPETPSHRIHLKPLQEIPAIELFQGVLGTRRLDPAVSRKILLHAGGNPLFLIEMAETIKRHNLLECSSHICRLRLQLDALEIPENIRGVLSARLDSLPASVKEVAQLAAVIGTEFSHELLAALTGETGRLNQCLKLLEREGIIDRISADRGGQYVFHHQMMQEIAYHEILRKNRRQFHHQVGLAIETLYRDNLTRQAGFLAYHFYQSQDWHKALAYTLEAGDQAKRAFACGEALMCFERALDILKRGTWERAEGRALQIYKWKGGMHFCLGQISESHQTFYRMLREARKLADREAEGESLFRLGWTAFFDHRPLKSIDFLQKAIDLARKYHLSEIVLKAASFKGFVHSVLGEMKKAKPLLVEALDLSDDVTSPEGRAWCLSYLLQYYNWTGELFEALAISEELQKLNESLQSPFFHIVLHFRRGLIYGALGKLDQAEKALQKGLKHLESGDEKFWKPRFLNTLGWIRSEGGDLKEAMRLNHQALVLALPTGDPETIHNSEINVGENHLEAGDLERAKKILYHVRGRIRHKRYLYAGWRYRTRLLIALADLHGKSGEHALGLQLINRALKLAREKGAAKHEAKALIVKAALIFKTRPRLAESCLKRAHELSLEMGAKRLSKRIEKRMKGI